MWVNIVSVIGMIVSVLAIHFLIDKKYFPKLLWIVSIILLLYKIGQYVYLSFHQGFTYPVEISTITYFAFSIIVAFQIKKLYSIASFFGVLSGIGYYLYYSILGFQASFHLGTYDLIIALISHGIIMVGGVYLLINYKFDRRSVIIYYLIVILILIHAGIFYYDKPTGNTFVFLLVKPNYLNIFDIQIYNIALKIAFYSVYSAIYLLLGKFFIHMNQRLYSKKDDDV